MSSGLVFLFGKMKYRPEAAGSGFIGDSQIVLQACYFCCSEQARGGFHDHDFLQSTALLFLAIGEQVGRVSGVPGVIDGFILLLGIAAGLFYDCGGEIVVGIGQGSRRLQLGQGIAQLGSISFQLCEPYIRRLDADVISLEISQDMMIELPVIVELVDILFIAGIPVGEDLLLLLDLRLFLRTDDRSGGLWLLGIGE